MATNVVNDSVVVVPFDYVMIKNLGVLFYGTMSFDKQVLFVAKSASWYLRKIWKIREDLIEDSAKPLTRSYTTYRLDYCNSLIQSTAASPENSE